MKTEKWRTPLCLPLWLSLCLGWYSFKHHKSSCFISTRENRMDSIRFDTRIRNNSNKVLPGCLPDPYSVTCLTSHGFSHMKSLSSPSWTEWYFLNRNIVLSQTNLITNNSYDYYLLNTYGAPGTELGPGYTGINQSLLKAHSMLLMEALL